MQLVKNNTAVRLVKDADRISCNGGTITYRVLNPEGEYVGGIADYRDWAGHKYGGRRWLAWHRLTGDQAARWNTEGHRTRQAAVAAITVELRRNQAAGTMQPEVLADAPGLLHAATLGGALFVYESTLMRAGVHNEKYQPVEDYLRDTGAVLVTEHEQHDLYMAHRRARLRVYRIGDGVVPDVAVCHEYIGDGGKVSFLPVQVTRDEHDWYTVTDTAGEPFGWVSEHEGRWVAYQSNDGETVVGISEDTYATRQEAVNVVVEWRFYE
ncbi:MAG: hypothetical protein J2P18_09740 [Nocardia sp.]|nr:hypothetical protein [Nocardia sp.]